MELSVVKPGNADAGTVSVSDVAFAREFNEDLVHQVVTAYLAGARQGTRAQKTALRSLAVARSPGARRVPVVPVRELFAPPSGVPVV